MRNKNNNTIGTIILIATLLIFETGACFIGYHLSHFFEHSVTFFTMQDLIACYGFPIIILGILGVLFAVCIGKMFDIEI